MLNEDIKDNEINIEIVKQLSFIRYMYAQGIYYANQPDPISSVSILLFHDSVEFFLQIVCRFKNINCNDCYFMDYFTKIQTKTHVELKAKEEMRLLNHLRNDMKHAGRFPSKIHIDAFKSNILDFFQQNTSLVFDLDFSSLSLSEFVKYVPAKEHLKRAEEEASNEDYKKAIEDTSIAFDMLIKDYVTEKTGYRYFVGGMDRFFSPRRINTRPTLFNRSISNEIMTYIENLSEYDKALEDQIKAIQENLKIITLNIDYKKYIKFRRIIEEPFRPMGGGPSMFTTTDRHYTKEEYQFCMDFTIESALKIQELDFDV